MLGYNVSIINGSFNNANWFGGYRWFAKYCVMCGIHLYKSYDGVRESGLCYKCLGNLTKVSIVMTKSKIMSKTVSLDEQRLHTHLDNNPDDKDTRKVLADIMEEEGREDECNCQRWLIEHHKYPDNKLKVFNLSGWHWWSCADGSNRHRVHAVIAGDIQKSMPKGEWLYSSRIEAEEVLALALVAYYRSKISAGS